MRSFRLTIQELKDEVYHDVIQEYSELSEVLTGDELQYVVGLIVDDIIKQEINK